MAVEQGGKIDGFVISYEPLIEVVKPLCIVLRLVTGQTSVEVKVCAKSWVLDCHNTMYLGAMSIS